MKESYAIMDVKIWDLYDRYNERKSGLYGKGTQKWFVSSVFFNISRRWLLDIFRLCQYNLDIYGFSVAELQRWRIERSIYAWKIQEDI